MKTVFVTRHAHRDTSHREMDNGLSAKGWEQARALADHLKSRVAGKSYALLSSPKLRCQETLEPLALALKGQVEVSALLDEGSSGDMEKRILTFVGFLKGEGKESLVFCSHGDWIPVFFHRILGEELNLRKGACAELIVNAQGQMKLVELHQSL